MARIWNEVFTRGKDSRWLIALYVMVQLAAAYQSAAYASNGQADCRNENLREAQSATYLSECRAYEMVTPPYKEGYQLITVKGGYASDGESAILYGLATLANNQGAGESITEGALYLDTRTETGWQLTPLNAPLSRYVGQIPLSEEINDGMTLWEQHTPHESVFSRGLYARSRSGEYSFVGPLSPRPLPEEESTAINTNSEVYDHPVAATENYGHVVLEATHEIDRWPFDPTVGATQSVYEYSGADNREPVLVGVKGGRNSRELIGLCGTSLGGGLSGSRYNALSKDGETIFFTVSPCGGSPSTAEVYARVHGALTSTGQPQTPNISANTCTLECGTEESGKNFEGASANGQLAYFTSTQKLTNTAVDGTASGSATSEEGCAVTTAGKGGCTLYEYEVAGEHLKSVSIGGEVLGVLGIAENGERVYYASRAEIESAGSNVYGQLPIRGEPNIYVYNASSGKTAFVATLSYKDERDWMREFLRPVEVTGESGRFLLFLSLMQGVTPDDVLPGGRSLPAQLFEYKAAEEGSPEEPAELVRITKGEDGFNENGLGVNAGVERASIAANDEQLGNGVDFKSSVNKLNITPDGSDVFFVTAGQLSALATNSSSGCTNVYVFHAPNSDLANGAVHLISDGGDVNLYKGITCGAAFMGIDESGKNVLFSTADQLLPSDTDGAQRDIYDARIEGGFNAEPLSSACAEELCEGIRGAPPALSPAVTAKTPGEKSVSVAPAGPQTVKAHKSKRKENPRPSRSCKHRAARSSGRTGCKHRSSKARRGR